MRWLSSWVKRLQQPRTLGYLGPLLLSMERSVWLGLLIIGVFMTVMSFTQLGGTGLDRLTAAVLATIAWWMWELVHHLGHYAAGAYAGAPMSGIHFYWMLGRSLYPAEVNVSANIHLRRAVGGPAISVLAAVVCLLLARISPSGILWFVFITGFWANLLVFTLGALLPLGFTDGSTILRYWKLRQR